MAKNSVEKGFYHPICNASEIERVFNVQNIDDYLLKIRANTIVDHMRLFRVYRNYALAAGENWSLEKSFSTRHYTNFLAKLDPEKKRLCQSLKYGDVFSNKLNGQIFNTEYTPLVTISNSLKYFFKFINLGFMDFGDRVPFHVRVNSLKIALRLMFRTETLDFLMDPRGIIPTDIEAKIESTIPYQMQFIAGHEFAHYILTWPQKTAPV